MSAFALLTAGLAAFAPLASAYTTPVGDSPSGNAIYEPGLNSVVTAGKAFTITWEPTTTGNVSLLLCKGPSSNCVITSTLADSIENSGSFAWTPSTDLAPSQPTGYGIELVVVGTGQYQYSTQFGLSNPSYKSSSSSSSAKSATATTSSSTESSTSVAAVKAVDGDSASDANTTSTASGVFASSSVTGTAYSTAAVTGTAYSAVNGTATSVRGTGVPMSGWSGYANATAIKPTGSMTVPSSLKTSTATGSKGSSTASGSASSSTPTTGAAAHIGASFGGLAVAAGIAVFAL